MHFSQPPLLPRLAAPANMRYWRFHHPLNFIGRVHLRTESEEQLSKDYHGHGPTAHGPDRRTRSRDQGPGSGVWLTDCNRDKPDRRHTHSRRTGHGPRATAHGPPAMSGEKVRPDQCPSGLDKARISTRGRYSGAGKAVESETSTLRTELCHTE